MKNKLLGSILIIAGSSIGAGMLAMPITSAGVGFPVITILLVSIWFAMCYTALLMVEVYQYNTPIDGFDTLTKKYLGKVGNIASGTSLMFLIYALSAAYISGGGAIITDNINQWFNTELDLKWGAVIFTLIFGGIVGISTKLVDFFNRALWIGKLIFLIVLLSALFPHVQKFNLLHLPLKQGLIFTAIPAVFTSFGFHGSIPSIVKYLDGDKIKLKKAFILGSFFPLIVYFLWQLVVLGSFDQSVFVSILNNNLGLDGLIISIREMSKNPTIVNAFNIFATTALGTSFLGVSIGLFDYFMDWTKNNKTLNNRFIVSVLTFLLPLIFVLFYPKGFILALGYAAIAGVVLALIIPSLLFIKAMQYHKVKISLLQYMILAFIFILSVTVIASQLYIVFN